MARVTEESGKRPIDFFASVLCYSCVIVCAPSLVALGGHRFQSLPIFAGLRSNVIYSELKSIKWVI